MTTQPPEERAREIWASTVEPRGYPIVARSIRETRDDPFHDLTIRAMLAFVAAEQSIAPVDGDRLGEAIEALKPFVAHWQSWMDAKDDYGAGYNYPDNSEMACFARVTFGDLRRARAVIAATLTPVANAPTEAGIRAAIAKNAEISEVLGEMLKEALNTPRPIRIIEDRERNDG